MRRYKTPSVSRSLLLVSAIIVAGAWACSSGTTPVDSTDTGQDDVQDSSVSDTHLADLCAGVPSGKACDDGNACTVDDQCEDGVCVGGASLTCDSSEVCRPSTCDTELGCVYVDEPDGTTCAVGCFGAAACKEGKCEPDQTTAVQCPASNEPCISAWACDSSSSECSVAIFAEEGVDCDMDSDKCSLDACDGNGTCVATGEVETCEDKTQTSPCWTYTCAPKAGCLKTAFVEGVSCEDNNPCTYSDTCGYTQQGQEACLGEPIPIDDNNTCTDDSCADGVITHTAIDGIVCDPSLSCKATGICKAGSCEPQDECGCTDNEQCPQSTSACQTALCDAASGQCTMDNAADGKPCTIAGLSDASCQSGVCTPGCTPVDGGWTDWQWSDCNKPCGGGTKTGTRTCSNPVPSCGGLGCGGESMGTEVCNEQPCGDTLPLGTSVFDEAESVTIKSIPANVDAMTVNLWGGGGGGCFPGNGAGGAHVGGTFTVKAGDAIEIRVAGGGGAKGGGGGASYIYINGQIVAVAAGGGGAGCDGCHGCYVGPASDGGPGGPNLFGGFDGKAYVWTYGNGQSLDVGGGLGATPTAGGAGGIMIDNSSFGTCTTDGLPGAMHAGGAPHDGPGCKGLTPASYHLGGAGGGNGSGGGGGSGYYGGGSGASMYTYAGGGGGGGVSWGDMQKVIGTVDSFSGIDMLCGGQNVPGYNGTAGNGGKPGDYTNWPADYTGSEPGNGGLVTISL